MKNGKRILAMLLSIVMCVLLMPIPALAEEGIISAAEQEGTIKEAETGSISVAEEETVPTEPVEAKKTQITAEGSEPDKKETDYKTVDVSAYILQEGGLFAPNDQSGDGRRKGSKAAENESCIDDAVALLYAAALDWDGVAEWVTVDISKASCPESEMYVVWEKLLNGHSDLFYVQGLSYDSSDGIITNVNMGFNTDYYCLQDVKIYQHKMKQISAGMDDRWSDEQKALYLHDYLVTHCEYDLTYSNYDAYSAIVLESSVCQGYALAYRDLLQQCGVKCDIVTSWDLNHAWNIVTIGSAQYYVDCTWDDPIANPSEPWYQDYCKHEHFLRSRDGFGVRHNSTDWVDENGNDVYNNVETGTAYENAWWKNCETAIPHIDSKWAYFLGSDSGVYIHDYSKGMNTRLFSLEGKWYVWGSSSYYTGHSHLAAHEEYFYISTADKIYRFTSDGKREVFYSLTDYELTQGYIYGIRVEGNSLYYRLYTGYKAGDFAAEYSLALGEVIPDVIDSGTCGDSLTWALLGDGTLAISGTGAMTNYEYDETPWKRTSIIKKVIINQGVTSIGDNAFADCSNITSITISESVTELGTGCLAGCSSLKNVKIPAGVTSIGDTAFASCYALTSITIPAGVTSIGDFTFYSCSRLTSITIPEGVTELGTGCFEECGSLTEIIFEGSAPTIGEDCFYGVAATAYYPDADASWTGDVRQDYSGTITWVAAVPLTLTKTVLAIAVGKSQTLTAKDSKGKTVEPTWSSFDPAIATVDSSGKITGKAVGKTTITAKYNGGTAACAVRVLFKDVTDASLFYYEPIYNMVDKGVIGGYDDGTFRPYGNCNRAAVVTFLWRLAGKPEPVAMATFSDMTDNPEFNKAISWAAEEGITSGWSDNTFRPWNTCNRAAIVTFLWRYAGKPEPKTIATFNDMPTDNEDFFNAISWAAENGITTGYGGNLFKPWATCNRLAVASFLDRYDKQEK